MLDDGLIALIDTIIYEQKIIWKEAIECQFKVLSQNLSRRTDQYHKKPQMVYLVSDRDLNPEPPEYEGGMLTTWL